MKRILSLVMALAIMLSMVTFVSAEEVTCYNTGIELSEVKAHTLTLDNSYDYTCYYFRPAETGYYELTVDAGAEIAIAGYYWVQAPTSNVAVIEFECTQVGNQGIYVGITSTNPTATLTITKTGEYTPIPKGGDWVNKHTPSASNVYKETDLTYVNVKEPHTAVVGSDGYYHLDTASGPLLYVDMENDEFNIVTDVPTATTGFGGLYEGVSYHFKTAITAYAKVMTGGQYYPMTEDLYAFVHGYCYGGGGWTIADSTGEYQFAAFADGFDEDTAWMILCAYNASSGEIHTHSYTSKVTAPTCTEQGYTTHTCSCGASYTDSYVAAKGHSWDDGKVTTEPTETTEGVKTYTCSVCKETKTESIPVIEHEHSYTTKVTAPTCTEQGYTTYTCACGESYKSNYVAAKGHTEVVDKGIAATCTTAGKTEGKHCSVCNEILTAQEVIPAKGHSWDNGKVTTEPTETSEGVKTYTCSVCKETKTESIPALEHEHSYTTKVTAPTCTEQGYTTYTCACGASYNSNYVAAKGHTEVADKGYAATCTTAGKTDGKHCSVCNEILTAQETIPAKGHSWDNGKVTTEATETTAGVKTYTCSVCKETKTESIPAKGHSYTTKVTAPTCTEQGYTTYTCACGDSYKDNYTNALGHDYKIVGKVEPTTTTEGYSGDQVCSRCSHTIKGETLPKVDYVKPNFTDVDPGQYYADYVYWAHKQGLTAGTSATTFSPDKSCTRAEIMVFLWAANGRPAATITESPFSDVKEGDWYYDAVMWAVENKLTAGSGNGKFGWNDEVTRADFMMFLWGAKGRPAATIKNTFNDVYDTDYYTPAILWAVENKITAGTPGGGFSPKDICTRAQVVTFLHHVYAE